MDHSFQKRLEAELPGWVGKKLLTAASAEKIIAHVREEETVVDEEGASRLVPFLSIIGSAFVGLGFILYFAANWDTMSDGLKFGILVAATAAVSVASYLCLFVRDIPKTGHALALLGSLLYGSSIFLIGQTYNLGGTIPGAVLLWIAGVVPVAYVTGLSAYAVLLSILILVWTFSDLANFDPRSLENFIPWILIAFGFFLSGSASWHSGRFENFSKIFARIGFFFIFSSFFLFTFQDLLNTANASSHAGKLVFGMGALGIVAYLADLFRKRSVSFARDGFVITAVVGSTALAVTLSLPIFAPARDTGLPVLAVVTNLFFVAFVFLAISTGVARKSAFTVNVALFFVTVFIFTKYFDWFFDKMDRALFFIFGGALLVFVGWMVERRRRKLVGSITR